MTDLYPDTIDLAPTFKTRSDYKVGDKVGVSQRQVPRRVGHQEPRAQERHP